MDGDAAGEVSETSDSDVDRWDQELSTLARLLDAALAAPEGSEERRHCAEHLDRIASRLSQEQDDLERRRAHLARIAGRLNRARADLAARASSDRNDWMLEDGQSDLVERNGGRWLRLRKWEGERGIRAWMLVPPWYEPHEEDQQYFALKVQVGIWKRIAPILLKDEPWPEGLDRLADDAYPGAAARYAEAMRQGGPYFEVRMVSRADMSSRPDSRRPSSRPSHQTP
jgi:hypothetical protein